MSDFESLENNDFMRRIRKQAEQHKDLPEWHPTVREHDTYLSEIILPAINLELTDKTRSFIEDWNKKIESSEGVINLGTTGWDSHPKRDLINVENTEKDLI